MKKVNFFLFGRYLEILPYFLILGFLNRKHWLEADRLAGIDICFAIDVPKIFTFRAVPFRLFYVCYDLKTTKMWPHILGFQYRRFGCCCCFAAEGRKKIINVGLLLDTIPPSGDFSRFYFFDFFFLEKQQFF